MGNWWRCIDGAISGTRPPLSAYQRTCGPQYQRKHRDLPSLSSSFLLGRKPRVTDGTRSFTRPGRNAWRRLERAAPDLALLLLIFMKSRQYQGQREYRFAVWAEENRVTTGWTWRFRRTWSTPCSGFVSVGPAEAPAVEKPSPSGTFMRVEPLPLFLEHANPMVAPRNYDLERLPADLQQMTLVYAAVDALRTAVGPTSMGL